MFLTHEFVTAGLLTPHCDRKCVGVSSVSFGSQHASSLRMGGSGSKAKGVWPFSGGGAGGDPSSDGSEQPLARLRGSRSATPFVFTRRR